MLEKLHLSFRNRANKASGEVLPWCRGASVSWPPVVRRGDGVTQRPNK